jgi:hypothetical protein
MHKVPVDLLIDAEHSWFVDNVNSSFVTILEQWLLIRELLPAWAWQRQEGSAKWDRVGGG